MTVQVYEVVTDLHPSPSHSAAASWVVTGQNRSLVLFLSASLEETGQSLNLLDLEAFFVEVTGQRLNRACSEPDEDQVNVFYLTMMSWASFWQGTNLSKKELIVCYMTLYYFSNVEGGSRVASVTRWLGIHRLRYLPNAPTIILQLK